MTSLRIFTYTFFTAVAWSVAGSYAVAAQTSPTAASAGSSSGTLAFQIEPQSVGAALKAFAAQAGIELVYESGAVSAAARTPGLTGTFTPAEALSRLLAHTNLDYEFINTRTVSIRSADVVGGSKSAPTSKQLASGVASAPEADLQEVVVTAQKREERLQDVPVPVTAVSAATLLTNDNTRIQDYYSSVPNFSVSPSPSAGGEQMLAIRGITTGFGTNPTVGITIDDVPFGSSSNLLGNTIPDIDPSDLARIEVLRGPQGTLYGASSMGGLLKFVTVDPSTDQLSGRLEADINSVHNGNAPGYGLRGAANVPLTDTLAVRVSAFTREDPGYINNPVTGQDALNKAVAYGGRLSALWRPADFISIKFGALYQELKSDGSSDVDIQPGLNGLQQNYIPGIGGSDKQVQAYSVIANATLGAATLTSVTGYNINKVSDSWDFSYGFGTTAEKYFGVTGAPVFTAGKNEKFSQEIRVDVPLGQSVEWLIGGFYTHEKTPFAQDIRAFNQQTGANIGDILYLPVPTTYNEYAGFTDFTFRITDKFDVQVGARESRIEQTSEAATQTGADLGGSSNLVPEVSSAANAFTYLLTPRLRLSPDLMIYARLASGYRAGGPNSFNTDPTVPRQYNPDKTQNYELGLKGDVLDHRITFDGSIFYIDWKDLQLNLEDPKDQLTYTTNASRAKSEGVELSVQARPAGGLTLGAWVTWDNAVLTDNMPADSTVYGVAGDRLPYSSRFSGNLSVNDDFTITGNVTGYVGATVSYVGDRVGTFIPSPDRQIYPSYSRTDLHGGVRYEAWTANLFVNNVADQRGLLGGGAGTYPPFAFRYIQPRTVGLSVSRDF
jgi:iron complex outermembrane recepter protein